MTGLDRRLLRRRSGRARRAGGSSLLGAALSASMIAACGTAPFSPLPTSDAVPRPRLVVLGLATAASPIVVVDGETVRPVAAPPGDVQWIAADVQGAIVATTTDGSILRTTGPLPDHPGWHVVAPAGGGAGGAPRSFGIPAPAGDRIAALSAVFGAGKPASLAILGPAELDRTVRLPIEADGAPPAWLDPRRVIVPGLRPDGAPATVIVDITSGAVATGPGGVRAVAASVAAGKAVIVGADRRTLMALRLDRLEAAAAGGAGSGSTAPEGHAVPAPDDAGIATALALDATGRWLAVIWTDADLVPSIVVTYLDEGTWRETSRASLGAAGRAAVAWLPPATTAMPP